MDSYTVAELLRKTRTARRVNPRNVAITFEGRDVTYDELDERSDRLAAALAEQGFAKGDRVGVLLYNRVEWAEVFFALAKLGGVVVPINYLLKPQEVAFILDDCGADWVVFEQALRSTADGVRSGGDERRYVGIGVHDHEQAGVLDYEQLIGAARPDRTGLPAAQVRADDLFLLQYTSGTTGTPKGAMHSHATVLWNSFHQVIDYGVTADEVFLVVPALCWAAGFHDIALATLWMGGRIVLNSSTGFEPARFLETVQRERITSTLLVPTVLKRVLAEPTFDDYDLSSLRIICSGGEPVPVTAIEEVHRRLPTCALLQCYGMSEFPTMMLYLDAPDAVRKAGSAGRACSGAEIRVVDGDGNDTPPEQVGEIICRSPASMIGYYGREEASASTLVDGWLHTGDLAHVDDEGFVYISGRSKDMIITGGLNVYPAEVERVIAQHPAVLEAAMVGAEHPDWGEIGEALVVLQPDARLDAEELSGYLKEQLATYKIPKKFTFGYDPLPRTTSGKVQKFLVKERLGV